MNTTNHIINFATDGTASCLWTEAVPLQELGSLEVKRASYIEFNSSGRFPDMDIADQCCSVTHNYQINQTQPQRNENSHHAKNHITQIPKPGQRKIAV